MSSSPNNFSSETPDWSSMLDDLLLLILSHLLLLSDIASFGRVCTRWNSVIKYKFQTLRITPEMSFKRGTPMLLIPSPEADDSTENTRNLYSLPGREIYDVELPVPANSRCIGSTHGWLVFVDCISFIVSLYNPFYFGNYKGTIKLPGFLSAGQISSALQTNQTETSADKFYISKGFLSADPSSGSNYVFMIIYNKRNGLAYYKSEDSTWRFLNDHPNHPEFYDMTYYQGNFVAVSFWGEAYSCDVNSNSQSCEMISDPIVGPLADSTRRYILSLHDGDVVLQAVRMVHTINSSKGVPYVETICFMVYSLTKVEDRLKWMVINSLGDGALFLGDHITAYVTDDDFPELVHNSIYFTDDRPHSDADGVMIRQLHRHTGHQDSGIYVPKKNSVIYDYVLGVEKHKHHPPPVWIFPTI